MKNSKSIIYILSLILLLSLLTLEESNSQNKEYVCFPCGADCDKEIHNNPGLCSHCNMDLIEKSRVNFEHLTPEEVAEIVSNENEVILLDVRTPEEYESNGDTPRFNYGHLKDAINIPNTEIVERISEIEKFKNNTIIVYCSHSHRSPYVAQLLTDLGFTNVKNMSEGLSEFAEKDLTNIITGESLLIKSTNP